ncbi:MAG: class I SAM-dependent methyltransferase [Bdellovibrionota bacterium]
MEGQRAYALAWSRWVRNNRIQLTAEVWLPTLLRAVSYHGSPPRKLADIGCGRGDLLACAHEYFPACTLIGVDSNPLFESVTLGQVPTAQFIVGEATLLPTELRDTEVILSTGLVHLLSDDAVGKFLEQVKTNLAPGGTAVISLDAPGRMAREHCVTPSDDTKILDTSWSGAPETSYLRTQSFYEDACKDAGLSCSSHSNGRYLQLVLQNIVH